MSWAPSINDICERALRKIGAYAISSSGPRPREMEETRYWLDMHVAHITGTKRTWWNVPRTAQFTLTEGVREYDLVAALGSQAPLGIEFPIGVWLIDATGQLLHEVKIIRRQEYEALTPNMSTASQAPTMCYIDRQQKPTLTFLEAPDGTQAYTCKFLFQSYGPNLVKLRGLERVSLFRTSYTLYLVTATAALVGDGPVRKQPKDEVDSMKADAKRLWIDLEAYEDQEQNNEPARVQFYNGI